MGAKAAPDSSAVTASVAAAAAAAAPDSVPPLKIGVLHFSPSLRLFPLLADPAGYNPNTYDLGDPEERDFWCAPVLPCHCDTMDLQ
jgi:hypothetical protein